MLKRIYLYKKVIIYVYNAPKPLWTPSIGPIHNLYSWWFWNIWDANPSSGIVGPRGVLWSHNPCGLTWDYRHISSLYDYEPHVIGIFQRCRAYKSESVQSPGLGQSSIWTTTCSVVTLQPFSGHHRCKRRRREFLGWVPLLQTIRPHNPSHKGHKGVSKPGWYRATFRRHSKASLEK